MTASHLNTREWLARRVRVPSLFSFATVLSHVVEWLDTKVTRLCAACVRMLFSSDSAPASQPASPDQDRTFHERFTASLEDRTWGFVHLTRSECPGSSGTLVGEEGLRKESQNALSKARSMKAVHIRKPAQLFR